MPQFDEFNAACYLRRYPDLQSNGSGAKGSKNIFDNFGWMYKSTRGWDYGRPTNRELKLIADNLLWHWQNFGIKEGRVPGCDLPGTVYDTEFNAGAYTARYPDVHLFGVNPYLNDPYAHYQNIGRSQNRIPGFELVTLEGMKKGILAPGTYKIVTDEDIIAANKAGIDKTYMTGDAASLTNPSDRPTTFNLKNGLLIGGIGLAAFLLLRRKKHK